MKKELETVNKDMFFYSDEFVDNPNEIYCDYHFTKDILLQVMKPNNNFLINKDHYEKFKNYVIWATNKVAEEHISSGNISTYSVQVQEKHFPYLEIKYVNRDNVEKSLYYEIILSG